MDHAYLEGTLNRRRGGVCQRDHGVPWRSPDGSLACQGRAGSRPNALALPAMVAAANTRL